MSNPQRKIVVFDLGGVLIEWNPRHLYRKLFAGDEAGMERFLAEVCSPAWNLALDEGRGFDESVRLLTETHPHHGPMIAAYRDRWVEMLDGQIEGSVKILEELKGRGIPLYALTNWSHETFPLARELFPFLGWFQGILVSGEEKLIKPDPRIYQLLMERFGLSAGDLVYIDDNPGNARAATDLGMHGLHFTGPEQLRRDLAGLGLL